jgi:NAD(P)-dependent dehydrogenase (short-subunit alcohol dehydrogenase family)
MAIRYDDRVAIVTGAGAGLGEQHAKLLASRGAKVVVNDPGGAVDGRGTAAAVADKVVAEIKAAGGEAVANYDSVATWAGAQNIIKTAMDTWGRLDILVANAGILRDKSFNNMDMEDFEFVMQVHLMGTVYCTKAAWQIMRNQRYGRIVVTTSGSGTVGNFGQANYGAAKMAVNGFINVMRHEGQNYNIKLNAISPSARTRMTESLIPPEVAEWMRPDLVSPAVAYMCSEQCDFSGEVIGANAGHFRRVKYVETAGVFYDPAAPVTIEMFADALPQIMDMSTAIEHGMSSRRLRERLVAMGRVAS